MIYHTSSDQIKYCILKEIVFFIASVGAQPQAPLLYYTIRMRQQFALTMILTKTCGILLSCTLLQNKLVALVTDSTTLATLGAWFYSAIAVFGTHNAHSITGAGTSRGRSPANGTFRTGFTLSIRAIFVEPGHTFANCVFSYITLSFCIFILAACGTTSTYTVMLVFLHWTWSSYGDSVRFNVRLLKFCKCTIKYLKKIED